MQNVTPMSSEAVGSFSTPPRTLSQSKMAKSISRCHFALRRTNPILNSVDLVLLTEALRAREIFTKENAEAVLTEKSPLDRVRKLTAVLQGVLRSLDLLCLVLCEIGHQKVSDRILQLYEDALFAPPDVHSISYENALCRGGVPRLPVITVSRGAAATDIRDALMTPNSTQRIVVIHGMAGYGKTTLLLEAIRNEVIVDFFNVGIVWCSCGPNAGVEQTLSRIRRWIGNTDSKKLLIAIDDVWDKEIVTAVAENFEAARVVITSRCVDCLDEVRSQCVLAYETSDGFSLDECRRVFAERLRMSEEELPVVSIDAICCACSCWPLGVTSAAQFVVECFEDDGLSMEQSLDDCLALMRKKEYKFLHANWIYGCDGKFLDQFDTDVDLHFAVHLSVAHLKGPLLARLEGLAALDPDVWLSSQALRTIWAHLGMQNVSEVASQLPGVLTSICADRAQFHCKLHDVMRSVVRTNMGADAILESNRQITTNYERHCGGEWGLLPDDGYIIPHLLHHLELAGRSSEIPDAFGDFFFVSKLFATSGCAATLQRLRRYAAEFATSEQELFRDALVEALEEVACAGTNPLYELSFSQSLLQLPRDHRMFGWALQAMRNNPLSNGLWLPTSQMQPVTHSRRPMPILRQMRGSFARDRSHGDIACVALNASKELLVAVGSNNSLIVCDAHSLICTASGLRLLLKDVVQQIAIMNKDRSLLLLTERQELFCAHQRSCVQDLPRDSAVQGESERVLVLRILQNVSVQRFALQDDRMTIMDSRFRLRVMQLSFVPRKNVLPEIAKVSGPSAQAPISSRERDRNSVRQIFQLATKFTSGVKQPCPEQEGVSVIPTVSLPLLEHFVRVTSLLMAQLSGGLSEEFRAVSQSELTLSITTSKKYLEFLIASLQWLFLCVTKNKTLPMSYKLILRDLKVLKDLVMNVKEPSLEMSAHGTFLAVWSCEDVHRVTVYKTADVTSLPLVLRLPEAVTAFHFVHSADTDSPDNVAVAFGHTIGVWSIRNRHICLLLEHQSEVWRFAVDPELELCATFEIPVTALWRLSLTSESVPILTVDQQSNSFEDMWFAERLSFISQKKLGHLRMQKQPPISRILSFYHFSPAVLAAGDRLLLVSTVADEALFIIDPATRRVLLSDVTNKIKNRVFAAWRGGIAVGGLCASLCEYRYLSNGHFVKAPSLPSLGLHLQFSRITALEFTARGSLVIGLENGAVWLKVEGEDLNRLKAADGKFVVSLLLLKKSGRFIALAANASSVDLSVWRESEGSASLERKLDVANVTASYLQTISTLSYLHWQLNFFPKVSTSEKFVAVVSAVMTKRVTVTNIDTGATCEVALSDDMIFVITSVLFHPLDDHILFLSCGPFVMCVRLEENGGDLTFYWHSSFSFNEDIYHLSILDNEHLIVTSDESVTLWDVSSAGQLSQGRQILSVAKVEGKLQKTFASPSTVLVMTASVHSENFRIYSLRRSLDT